ncbi:helix-turn-helix domain-containing protein [Vibrio sp.]|uniref:AraC family transcriptional regulator n=1 Tax=Vibrio sp. TaxID=678 RepID=UPI003D0E7BF6
MFHLSVKGMTLYRLLSVAFLMLGLFLPAMQAFSSTSLTFYSLPTLSQGRVFVAQNLFPGDEGGIWIHDTDGKVVFFDGQTILPRRGSALPKNYQHLTYLQGAFWTFVDNELYRTYPGRESERVLVLTPGVTIKNIGTSSGYLWLTDDQFFYTYRIADGELQTFSLSKLYQLNQASQIIINDAVKIRTRWVLATNVGTYLSTDKQFTHITQSGKHTIKKLLFSAHRNHLLVGTHRGALLIDLDNPSKVLKRIGESSVSSMIETNDGYWVGTDSGLRIYSLSRDEISDFSEIKHTSYGLPDGKVYALAHDQYQGIWIATQQGVRYVSLFSQMLTRYFPNQSSDIPTNSAVKKIQYLNQSNRYFLINQDGLFLLDPNNKSQNRLIHKGGVNDIEQIGQVLWIASDDGVSYYPLSSDHRALLPPIPQALRSHKTDFLAVDQHGILWGISTDCLWSYNPNNHRYIDYSQEWLAAQDASLKLTWLHTSSRYGLLIGSEQGVYQFNNDKIIYYKDSASYGSTIQVVEAEDGRLWFLTEFEVFHFQPLQHLVRTLPLIEENLRLKCLLLTSQGLWLSSSKGLTLYHFDGSVKKHIGSPYGLINNEFQTRACAVRGKESNETLLFAAREGFVHFQSQQIADAPIPRFPIILSQVSIDHRLAYIGGLAGQTLSVDYGKAISFHFGSFSHLGNKYIEFRLNEEEWHPFEGPHLTLDHLFPGDYHLSLRDQHNPDQIATWSFKVVEPWYLSVFALISYLLFAIVLILLVIHWRSRVMSRLNDDLRQQVALKTRQAQQQSKWLIHHNQQLRKKIQIRQLWFKQWLLKNQSLLTLLVEKAAANQSNELIGVAERLSYHFKQINVLNDGWGAKGMCQPLGPVLKTMLEGWKHDFEQADIKISCDIDEQLPNISLKQPGLDSIFNLIFSDALNRLHRHQTLTIKGIQRGKSVVVTITDFGEAPQQLAQQRLILNEHKTQTLDDVIQLTGGYLQLFSSSERNLIELTWPAQIQTAEHSAAELHLASDVSESHWLSKLEKIIGEHYSDPEFTTSVAAALMYVSERSLQRRFKNATGKTFKEYLTEYRLDQACRLLINGEKVSQVAFLCGFNDPSYFSQRFKSHFGLSPSQFVEDDISSS